MEDLLDYEEYYNDDEQAAYDHGYIRGRWAGFFITAAAAILALIIAALIPISIKF